MAWFLSGLDQETVIGELVSYSISETRCIKRETSRRPDQGESNVDTEGKYRPAWVHGCQRKDTCESITCKV